MTDAIKRQILATRIERMREHVERVGSSPAFERALSETEAELRRMREQPR